MLLYITYFIFSIYIATIIFFIIGICKINNQRNLISKNNNISVIVCVRNGDKSIENILNDLKNQIYDGSLEFIIIDDDSSDNTKNIINSFVLDDNRFKYFNTKDYKSDLKHKKKALDYGISKSKYNWLLFTDVDCRVGKNWCLEISKTFCKGNYIVGFSTVKKSNSLASKFQHIDFQILMVSALSAVALNTPLACIGQNQAYNKNLFIKNRGFSKIKNILQGDDSIFMHLCRRNKECKVTYSFHKDSFVSAKTHSNWKDLILQRTRWAGDANIMWKYNKLLYLISVSTFYSNLIFIILVITSNFKVLISLLLIKYTFEYLLYILSCKKLNDNIDNILFQIWFILQIPYIIIVGLGSFYASNLKWKGR